MELDRLFDLDEECNFYLDGDANDQDMEYHDQFWYEEEDHQTLLD